MLTPSVRLRPLLVVLALTLVAGCSGSSSSGEPPPATTVSTTTGAPTSTTPAEVGPITVVVLGSSSAFGIGPTDPTEAWVQRYADHLEAEDPGNEVVNLAVPATTTFQILPTGTPPVDGRPAVDPEHNITAALALDPDAVIVNMPSNDLSAGYAASEQLDNTAAVVDEATDAGVTVWVATSQPRNLDAVGRAGLEEVRAGTVATYGDRALDFWTDLAEDDGSVVPTYDSGDGIHLTGAAHLLLFERVRYADLPAAVAARPGG